MSRRRKIYYTEEGEVKELLTRHYAVFSKGQRIDTVWFVADTTAEADSYALRWAKRHGYKIYRIKHKRQ